MNFSQIPKFFNQKYPRFTIKNYLFSFPLSFFLKGYKQKGRCVMHQPLYFFLLMTLKHSSYAVPVTLSVVWIRNHKPLFLLIRKSSYPNSLAVCILLNGAYVNKKRHSRFVHRLILLRHIILIFLLLNKHKYMFL